MGKSQRDKGKRGELEVAHILQEHGFGGERTAQRCGKGGTADVRGLPGFHLEVKRHEKLRLMDWVKQAEGECNDDEIPCVVFRQSNEPWRIVLRFEDFMRLVEEAK